MISFEDLREIPGKIAIMGIAGWHGAMAHEGWLVSAGRTSVCGTLLFAEKDQYHIDGRPRFPATSSSW
jgi:hypothetical protein